jgi:hypothetical protein
MRLATVLRLYGGVPNRVTASKARSARCSRTARSVTARTRKKAVDTLQAQNGDAREGFADHVHSTARRHGSSKWLRNHRAALQQQQPEQRTLDALSNDRRGRIDQEHDRKNNDDAYVINVRFSDGSRETITQTASVGCASVTAS